MVQLPDDAPSPRLCVIEKTSVNQEYGYNLHAEKGRGQFVGMVDKNSPAELGGLRMGDRIFAVNGHSIVGESHKKVLCIFSIVADWISFHIWFNGDALLA
uniref:PDZ domain-containing protein n=1 Tax=Heterorhabditis bacteriophora TaxID=37862 RepID=A0A1I7X734_HETBA